MNTLFDVAILGAGTVGTQYYQRLNGLGLKVLWLDTLGQQQAFKEKVTGVMKHKGQFMIMTEDKEFAAKTVIVATGRSDNEPFAGEVALRRRGVSYCAVCDGELYRNKVVAVILKHPAFLEELKHLASLAQQVYVYTDEKLELDNVTLLKEPIQAISGSDLVSGIITDSGTMIPVDGVFMLYQNTPPSVFLYGADLTGDYLKINNDGSTNVVGLFGSGDCTINKTIVREEMIVRQVVALVSKDEETNES